MEIAKEMEDAAREVERRVRPQIEEAKKRLGTLEEQVTGYVRANPGKCVLGALAVGYLIGKLARR
jgi:ElaB/YqjD/DUF883 family membrane-anchored ribosome-binding protein